MSGVAVFSLKCPSLLAFDENRKDPAVVHNLKALYGVQKTPFDTQMRETLDDVDPDSLRAGFKRYPLMLREEKPSRTITFSMALFS